MTKKNFWLYLCLFFIVVAIAVYFAMLYFGSHGFSPTTMSYYGLPTILILFFLSLMSFLYYLSLSGLVCVR
jgi:uncharacterized membrane protein YhaH (DUF805 family)